MQYGIQRRSIYLAPPSSDDLEWLFAEFDREEVWGMFGFESPSSGLMRERHASGTLVTGILHRAPSRARIGFIICFPPTMPANAWEFGTVIPDPKDRDAFSAINGADAMTHYMFDHLRIERGMWRVRDDNVQSNALARRMGYRPYGRWEIAGHKYNFYRMTRERWEERYARLDRGEEANPSGLEDTFVVLEGPPYEPRPLKVSSSEPEEVEPPASGS